LRSLEKVVLLQRKVKKEWYFQLQLAAAPKRKKGKNTSLNEASLNEDVTTETPSTKKFRPNFSVFGEA
jgi:hypothetical protein